MDGVDRHSRKREEWNNFLLHKPPVNELTKVGSRWIIIIGEQSNDDGMELNPTIPT
jgi:hypothetical protein